MNDVKKLLRRTLSFCFGQEKCVCCSRPGLDMPLCIDCQTKYLGVEQLSFCNRCMVCGMPLVSEQKICMSCREERVIVHADRVFPLFTYRSWKKLLLFQWKMEEKRGLADFFANRIDRAARMLFGERCIFVPVPPRPGKKRAKGWDQIEDLCRILHYKYGHEVKNLLRRLSAGEQKKLDRRERLETRGRAYEIEPKVRANPPVDVRQMEVILVDDVLTTGITVENCACCLKDFGVKTVNVMTLFIVD